MPPRRPKGYSVVVDPGMPNCRGPEHDTITCSHCQRIVFIKPGSGYTVYLIYQGKGRYTEEPGAFCGQCMKPICIQCHNKGGCLPWEKHCEIIESRQRLLRQVERCV